MASFASPVPSLRIYYSGPVHEEIISQGTTGVTNGTPSGDIKSHIGLINASLFI